MPCDDGKRERNKNEEYVNFQFNRLWLIWGISGILWKAVLGSVRAESGE